MSMKSYITWAGFSEEGVLSTLDDNGVLSGFNFANQQWTPLVDLKRRHADTFRNFWVTGILDHELLGIELPQGVIQPPVQFKSVSRRIKLEIPVIQGDSEKEN